jgi:aquaporin Z
MEADRTEADNDRISSGRIMAAELVGTAVLVMGGPGSAILAPDIGLLGVALAFGLSLLVMAYAIGPISGCHINPAVTLGMLLTKKVDLGRAVISWVGQVIGGIIGALVIFLIANSRDGFERGGFAANGWDRNGFSSLGATILVEIVFTAIFVWVVLTTTSSRFTWGIGGIVAGLTLTLVHLVTIPVDNTSVNPARSLATAIFADTDPNALGQLWAFIVFPMVGAVVGVLLFLLIDDTKLEDTMLDSSAMRAARDAATKGGNKAVGAIDDVTD